MSSAPTDGDVHRGGDDPAGERRHHLLGGLDAGVVLGLGAAAPSCGVTTTFA